MRGPAAQHPPEALNDIALRTITRQPFHPQLRMGRSHVFHQGPTMPGCMINRDDDCGILPGRIGAGDIPQMLRKRHLQTLLFALTQPRFAARQLLQQAGGQLPRHHVKRGQTIDLILVVPCADGGAMALPAQRGPSRRYQRKAGLILAQEDTRSGLGFFFNAASASLATRCSSGSPRK